MNDKEYIRLRRLVLRCFFLSLILTVAAVFVVSYKLKSLNTEFANQKNQVVEKTIIEKYQSIPAVNGVNGQNGQTGLTGTNGVDGVNGQNGTPGQNVTPDEIAKAVSDYLQANPPLQGLQGPIGIPGKTILLRLDPITNLEECQYLGDLAWQPISECE